MSYETQALLEADGDFQQRARSCTVQQADYYKDAAAADQKALAYGVLRDDPGLVPTFIRLAAAGPGVADKVDTGNGTIDSSLVLDADLLSLTQGNWPIVTSLYFNTDGTPRP